MSIQRSSAIPRSADQDDAGVAVLRVLREWPCRIGSLLLELWDACCPRGERADRVPIDGADRGAGTTEARLGAIYKARGRTLRQHAGPGLDPRRDDRARRPHRVHARGPEPRGRANSPAVIIRCPAI